MIPLMNSFSLSQVLKRQWLHILSITVLVVVCALSIVQPAAAATRHPTSGGAYYYCTHVTTISNTFDSSTDVSCLSHLILGNTQYLLFVTPNWNPNGITAAAFDSHPLGVWYDSAAGSWAIYNEDGAHMPLGAAFNIFTLPNNQVDSPGGFIHIATTANSAGNSTVINNALTNNLPNQGLLVEHNWSASTVLDPHPLGVEYANGQWRIIHEDGTPIPAGAAYNVFANTDFISRHTATAANSSGDWTDMNLNYSIPLATQARLSTRCPGLFCSESPLNNSLVGVWFNPTTQLWSIFNENGSAVPSGAIFMVS